MNTIYLSLSSNLGNRGDNLQSAIILLEKWGIKIVRSSSIYETEPVGIQDQPWFYNMVFKCETELSPQDVLKVIGIIERSLKRVRSEKNGPRTIDIDILLFEDLIIEEPDLVIPHKEMHERNFVLMPFTEVDPDVCHPILKKSASELFKECFDTAIVQKLESRCIDNRKS
jgi:2-amino-4-hydroxy-6-hydroxymethyldihydropteridine diphosphokinase